MAIFLIMYTEYIVWWSYEHHLNFIEYDWCEGCFKTCEYFTRDYLKDVINDIYLNSNVKLTVVGMYYWFFLFQYEKKDSITLVNENTRNICLVNGNV